MRVSLSSSLSSSLPPLFPPTPSLFFFLFLSLRSVCVCRCHRFLLHYHHICKSEKKSRTRPHTSLGLYTDQNNHACLTMNYPRVQTPLVPTKTPTFHRISKKRERSMSLPQTPLEKSCRPHDQSRVNLTPQTFLFEENLPTGQEMRSMERLVEVGGSIVDERHGGRREKGGRGRGRVGGRERSWRRSKEDRSTVRNTVQESRNNSTQVFKRDISGKLRHPYVLDMDSEKARNSSFTGSPLKQYWSSEHTSSPQLPQSLRQSYTPSPLLWSGDVDGCCSRGDCITPYVYIVYWVTFI